MVLLLLMLFLLHCGSHSTHKLTPHGGWLRSI